MAGSALITGASNGAAQQSAAVPAGASLYLIIEWTEDVL